VRPYAQTACESGTSPASMVVIVEQPSARIEDGSASRRRCRAVAHLGIPGPVNVIVIRPGVSTVDNPDMLA
jgi:hypothetical protein